MERASTNRRRAAPKRHGLGRDRQGTAALEFALVCVPLLTFLLGLLEVGYDLYAQVSLDYAVHLAARKIQIGAAQTSVTAADFQAKYLCPAVGRLIPCGSISVNVQTVSSDYYSNAGYSVPVDGSGKLSTSGYTYCPGQPNQLMLVTALYAGPSLLGSLIPAMRTPTSTGYSHVTMSSAAFINENFPATTSPPAGC